MDRSSWRAITRTLRPPPKATRFGWHHTGDIGYLDEENFLYIVDRAKDMIITGGFNVYSIEVEQALLQHPDVMDSAVFGHRMQNWARELPLSSRSTPAAL